MPEGTTDATILIATSFQALNRVIQDKKDTMVCDCTIVILFAAFFIEANLNHIIDQLDKHQEMLDFLYGKKRHGEKYPGLQDKLGWFYNQYIEKSKVLNKTQMRENGINKKLVEKFPGFEKIYQFRNNISHGKVDLSMTNRETAEELRQKAKNIVHQLFDIAAAETGYTISRDITYKNAVSLQ